LCSEGPRATPALKDYVGRVPLTHHMMFATGKNEQVRVERHSIDQGLDVVPVAKCNLQFSHPCQTGGLAFRICEGVGRIRADRLAEVGTLLSR
jgi:hypothetical protein